MIKSFLLAVQFLTALPIKIKQFDESKLAQSLIFFPLVGILLGTILIWINNVLYSLNFQEFSLDIIIVIALIALTGGLHLDGLSDTFDGISSGKNKEETLAIMRDSHAGVMGISSVISIILLKIALLYSINAELKPIALLLMCVSGRWSMVFSMFLFPYARPEGKARAFIRGMNSKIFFFATLIAIACVYLIWNAKGLLILIIIACFTWIFGRIIRNKIGGITGDTIGATNEIMETVALLGVCLTKGMRI